MLIDFHWDVETRSKKDLKLDGQVNYMFHESTQCTVITWCFGRTGIVKAWRIGMQFPQDLIDVAAHPERYNMNAFKVDFDYLVWTVILPRQFPYIDWKRPQVPNLSCTMAIAAHFRMGHSLDIVAKMLKLPVQKDTGEGRRIMLKHCKPDSKGNFPVALTDEEWHKLVYYATLDTAVLRAAYYAMGEMPAQERWAWEWTFKRNMRGLYVDVKLVEVLYQIKTYFTPILLQEFSTLTGGASASSPKQCLKFFQLYYPEIKNMQAETIDDLMIDETPVPPFVRRALEIKFLTSTTSLSKIDVALRHNRNAIIYLYLVFSKAQNKRWAGQGIQVQNFARFDGDREDKIDFELNQHDITNEVLAKVESLKDPLGFVKNLLRRIWVPPPGKHLYCGDWAKIEPTVLFWLLGMGKISKHWYEETAAAIYNMTPQQVIDLGKEAFERQIGKMANLSCQYGSGWKSFKKAVKTQAGLTIDKDLAKLTVKTYRQKYSKVPQLWKDLENAFRKVILYGQPTSLCEGKIFVEPMVHPIRGVQIRLPSGDKLYYPGARIHTARQVYDEENDKWYWREPITYLSDEGKFISEKHIYGGLICENVVSCIAQQLIAPALYRIEGSGFEGANLVHDELWAYAEPGRDADFIRLMCVRPAWAQDMDIGAEANSGVRYLK